MGSSGNSVCGGCGGGGFDLRIDSEHFFCPECGGPGVEPVGIPLDAFETASIGADEIEETPSAGVSLSQFEE